MRRERDSEPPESNAPSSTCVVADRALLATNTDAHGWDEQRALETEIPGGGFSDWCDITVSALPSSCTMDDQETVDKLQEMRLRTMAQVFRKLVDEPNEDLTFTEKVGMMVVRGWSERDNRRTGRRVREAK
jgi:hypothetical protein